MLGKVMAAALAIGATGGASIAVAENVLSPRTTEIAERAATPGAACKPVAFRVYFEPQSARLNSEARALIDTASRQVAGCDQVEFNLAADGGQIADAQTRRRVSERSVAILAAMREEGINGEVYVQPLSRTVIAAEKNAGPDFVEVAVAPAQTPMLMSSNEH